MQKFFVSESQIRDNRIEIVGEDVKHISSVLRLKTKEKIEVCNTNTNITYICEIENINAYKIDCNILEKKEYSTESNIEVDIYQGLPKVDKMEYIIQKSTELGVKRIIPVSMSRSIVKIDEKGKLKKQERWQKISQMAAEQSKRDFIPKVDTIMDFKDLKNNISNYDVFLIAFESEKENNLKNELKKIKSKENIKIGILIGPEGGIDEKEIKDLSGENIKIITLGKRILRTETASLNILSCIFYELES